MQTIELTRKVSPAKQIKEFRRLMKKRYRRFEQLTEGYTLSQRFNMALRVLFKRSLIIEKGGD